MESDGLLPSSRSSGDSNGSDSKQSSSHTISSRFCNDGSKSTATSSTQEVVSSELPLPSSPPPRYHATQFISFTINTLGGLAEHGECEGRSVDPDSNSCYLGSDDIESDVNHRLAILEEVLGILRNDVFMEEPEIDRDPGVLKILMLPEFFLRGPNGAYSTSQMFDSDNEEDDGVLIKLADKVRSMIFDDAFEDYLFVLGTVIAAESMDPKNSDDRPWEIDLGAKDIMYFNFSPVYRGGKHREGEKHHIVLKQYISGADFLSRTTLPNPSNFDMHAYAKADQSKVLSETFAKRNMTIVTDNYIEIDGIKIGIEICLDHRMGALWNSLRLNHESNLVDVQLITSAGMSIERGPNPLKHGGVVYLSDGEASSAACIRTDSADVFDANHVCRGKPDGLQHRPQGGAGYSSFVALSGCIDMEKSTLLEGYYSMYQPQGCANTLKTYGIDVMENTYYPPSIELYPTIDLPFAE
ncbi:hypothetical protein ACHAXR_003730 [Thalassiosira sp. AJA248-18]